MSTRPDAMVIATFSLISAPIKFMIADMIIAVRKGNALVYTVVAIAFAVSWKPLMNSNIKAETSTAISKMLAIFHDDILNSVCNMLASVKG